MCRVVKDVQLPLFKYAPVEPLTLAGQSTTPERPHNSNDVILDILPKPSLTTSRKDFLSAVKDRSLKISVSKLFGLDGGLNNEQKVTLETKEVRRYTINNPGVYFDALMGDELYERDVRALLKETSYGEAYLVVGFLTTSSAQWSQETSRSTHLETMVTVPSTEIAGVAPVPGLGIDPILSAQASTTQAFNRRHVSHGEEIFAVAYAPVKTGTFNFRRKKRVVIGRSKSAGANHLAFGQEDDDDSDGDSGDDDGDGPREPKKVGSGSADINLGENGGDFPDSIADEAFDF